MGEIKDNMNSVQNETGKRGRERDFDSVYGKRKVKKMARNKK